MLGGARVGGGLERRLVRAQAGFLVDLGAGIPEQNLGGDVAGDRLAAGVEQGDAFLPGSVEQERTGATPTGSVLPLESFSASLADTFSIRTVKISSAWADTPPMTSSSVARADILRILCDMVGLLH